MTRSQPLACRDAIRLAEPLDHPPSRVTAAPTGLNAFTSRLSGLAKLSAEELLLVQGLGRFTRSHVPHEEIGSDAKSTMSRVVVSGWACRRRMSSAGRGQIISLLLPGDVVGNLEYPELPSEDSFVALTPVVTADTGSLVKAVVSGDPAYRGLAHAVRLLGFHATATIREQIVRLGRPTTYERLMHLMLELHARFQVVGMATSHTFPVPISQEVLGDVVARSVVHVNRSMQQARRDGLLETRSGLVTVLDLQAMQVVADWIPTRTKPSISPPLGQLYARSA